VLPESRPSAISRSDRCHQTSIFKRSLASGEGLTERRVNADISVYDQEARLPALFQVKIEAAQAIDFDSDDEIDSDFEFDSMDDEYFDSAVTDTDEEDE
jgi:hypothetical protein